MRGEPAGGHDRLPSPGGYADLSLQGKGVCGTSHVLGRRVPKRKGAIFIAALGVTVVLSGLLLVFAQEMRTEAIAGANRVADAQAAAVEQAGEQWVLAQLQTETDPIALQALESEGL